MGKGRRKFTREFKIDAVKMLNDSEMSQAAAAESLGIGQSTLGKWKAKYGEDPESAFPGHGKKIGPDAELAAVQKENARLKDEVAILKKAAAYFAKHLR